MPTASAAPGRRFWTTTSGGYVSVSPGNYVSLTNPTALDGLAGMTLSYWLRNSDAVATRERRPPAVVAVGGAAPAGAVHAHAHRLEPLGWRAAGAASGLRRSVVARADRAARESLLEPRKQVVGNQGSHRDENRPSEARPQPAKLERGRS